jgi:hypothetical protein
MSKRASGSLEHITGAFKKYLSESNVASLDRKLKEYFQEVRSDARYRNGDAEFFDEILAQLSILFPLHISRKHRVEDLCRTGNISALVSAFEEDWLVDSLKKVLEPIYQAREHPIIWSLPAPVTLAGYDPQHGGPSEASKFYEQIANDVLTQNHIVFGKPKFVKSYNLAKAEIYRDFHDPSTRYDLLIVDFSWLPELAYQGHIVPLEPLAPDILGRFQKKVEKSFPDNDPTTIKNWTKVLDYLASAGDGFHYAFPLSVNSHGRLSIKSNPLPGEYHPERTNEIPFEQGAIQTAHSACCVYELYAHFALNKALPIKTSSEGTAVPTQIELVDFNTENAKMALAEYISRIGKSGTRQTRVKEFKVNHADELRELQKGSFGFDIAFNSELFAPFKKSLPQSDREKWEFSRPISRLHDGKTHYLTSLGGYGLAVSRQAVTPRDAFAMASRIFEHQDITVIEDSAGSSLPLGGFGEQEFADFLTYHCRPRIPFWSQMEEVISMTVQLLYDRWVRERQLNPGDRIDTLYKSILEWLKTNEAKEILTRLNKSIELTFINNGWQVGGGS